MKSVLWAIIGGLVSLILIASFIITLAIMHKSKCDDGIDAKHCNFVTVVRDANEYNDKSDAAVAAYGDSMCSALRAGELGKLTVESLEKNQLVIQAAKSNICPDAQ